MKKGDLIKKVRGMDRGKKGLIIKIVDYLQHFRINLLLVEMVLKVSDIITLYSDKYILQNYLIRF